MKVPLAVFVFLAFPCSRSPVGNRYQLQTDNPISVRLALMAKADFAPSSLIIDSFHVPVAPQQISKYPVQAVWWLFSLERSLFLPIQPQVPFFPRPSVASPLLAGGLPRPVCRHHLSSSEHLRGHADDT